MSEEYKNNFVVLTDEDGNEKEFEHIDTLEDNGTMYLALIPAELRSEERRVGKECRSRWSPYH